MNGIFVGLGGTTMGCIALSIYGHYIWAIILFILGLNLSVITINHGLDMGDKK
jgi:hypothetical protein